MQGAGRLFARNGPRRNSLAESEARKPSSANPMLPSLPPDVISVILTSLDLRGLASCARVQHEWLALAKARRDSLRLLSWRSTRGLHKIKFPTAISPVSSRLLVGHEGWLNLLDVQGTRHSCIPFRSLLPQQYRLRGPVGPSGLALSPTSSQGGSLYLSDATSDRIFHFLLRVSDDERLMELTFQNTAGGFGDLAGQLCAPGDLCLCGDLLFVLEGSRVSAFLVPSLLYSHRFGERGSEEGHFRKPSALAAWQRKDFTSIIFVADSGNHRIQAFEASTGRFQRTFGRKGSRPGEFRRPSALALVRDRLVVCELKGERLQVLDPRTGNPLQREYFRIRTRAPWMLAASC